MLLVLSHHQRNLTYFAVVECGTTEVCGLLTLLSPDAVSGWGRHLVCLWVVDCVWFSGSVPAIA